MKKAFWVIIVLPLWLLACSGEQPESADEVVVESSAESPDEIVSSNVTNASGELLIRDVSLIDGTGASLQSHVDIRISQGQIVEIASDLSAASGSEIIDGSDKYVIPGLIDAHAHLDAPVVFQLTPDEKAQIIEHTPKAFLYNGVTTVLNVSSDADWIFEQRQAERDGKIMSPRIYAMGRSLTPEGGWGSRHGGGLVDTEAALARARDLISRGTDGFKVMIEDGLGASGTYTRMSEEMMMAIAGIAQEHNVPIYTHAINLDEFHSAVTISSKAIIHGLEDPIPEGDTILQDMVENNVAMVPTQSLWEAFIRHDEAAADLNDPILRASVPHFLLDNMQDPVYRAEETKRFLAVANMLVYEWAEAKIPVFMENINKAHKAGVLLAAGTDAGGPVGFNFQGYNLPWEVKLFVQAGLSPMDALLAATRNGARVIGVEDKLGTVEVGKLADLLLLTANPLEDIENIRKIETIVYKGTVYPHDHFAYLAPGS
ncbi:MAG: amidohydrolase family protein [Gammaproteobacteria bacterium]|nr:amidohydrolase family protein [Gammaproteobacteria bacterium]